jgi:hypothetical protein
MEVRTGARRIRRIYQREEVVVWEGGDADGGGPEATVSVEGCYG